MTHTSGNANLDRVLGGGLPSGSALVIAGAPGTGKTVLAQQIAFACATETAPAIYVTSLSESQVKLVRHLEGFDFFDAEALNNRVRYQDVSEFLDASDQDDVIGSIVDQITRIAIRDRPSVLVIDSAKALRDHGDPAAFRSHMHRLVSRLSFSDTVLILVGEYVGEDLTKGAEFAVADAIIELTLEHSGWLDQRSLRVHKMRGRRYLSGRHAYEITPTGACVYPRIESVVDRETEAVDGRVSVGVPGIDRMAGGGLPRGDVTLVTGPSGAGKTVLSLQFVREGLRNGERCVYVALEETESAIRDKARAFGWNEIEEGIASGQLLIREEPIVELVIDRLADQISTDLASRPDRFVFDSMGELTTLARQQGRYPGLIWSLAQEARSSGASVLFTLETVALGAQRSVDALSHLFQNVIVMRYMADHSEIRRALLILKMRDSAHAKGMIRFDVGDSGMIADDQELENVEGLLGWGALSGSRQQ